MPRVLVIDNYDSFTYNLVQVLGGLGADVDVVLNDAIDVGALATRAIDGLLVSPGPATPDEAGISLGAIRALAGKKPVLGVCLGHQAIGQAFGGRVVRAGRIMHGKTSPIHHDGTGVFRGLPTPFTATRYHSLLVERATLPRSLRITAWTVEGEIMGLSHSTHRVEGVQFHPESFLTDVGVDLLRNWVESLGGSA